MSISIDASGFVVKTIKLKKEDYDKIMSLKKELGPRDCTFARIIKLGLLAIAEERFSQRRVKFLKNWLRGEL